MSILSELNTLMTNLNLPVEAGAYSDIPPDSYVVLTPLVEEFDVFCDNQPMIDIHEFRISFFTKGNYLNKQKEMTHALLNNDFTITARRFVGFEEETNYFHVVIDVAKHYEMEE